MLNSFREHQPVLARCGVINWVCWCNVCNMCILTSERRIHTVLCKGRESDEEEKP